MLGKGINTVFMSQGIGIKMIITFKIVGNLIDTVCKSVDVR